MAGNHSERVSYDQLTMGQWLAGFCQSMHDEICQTNRVAILEYFSWTSAKACHAVLLCRIEQGLIKVYTQVDKINPIRRAYAQRYTSQTSDNFIKNSNAKRDRSTKTIVCQCSNLGTCMHSATHGTKGTLYRHSCAFSHTKMAKPFHTWKVNAQIKINSKNKRLARGG